MQLAKTIDNLRNGILTKETTHGFTEAKLRKNERSFGIFYKSFILLSGLALIIYRVKLSSLSWLELLLGLSFILLHGLYLLQLFRPLGIFKERFKLLWLLHSLIVLNFVGYLLYLAGDIDSALVIYYPLVLIGLLPEQPTLKGFFLFGGAGAVNLALVSYLLEGWGMFRDIHYWQNAVLNGVIFFGGVMVVRQIIEYFDMANTDEVTGLKNLRYFRQQLHKEFNKARSSRRPLAMIVLGIDNYKSIVTHHGTSAGSSLLKKTAAILERKLRYRHTICRYDKDVFALLLTETNLPEAKSLAEGLIKAISEETHLEGLEAALNQGVNLTASAGVATYPTQCQTEQALLEKAEIAYNYSASTAKSCVNIYSAIFETNGYKDEVYNQKENRYPEEMDLITSCINAKDQYTRQHSQRVAEYASALAGKISLPDRLTGEFLWMAGLVHDLGKVEIPREILIKEEPLTDSEWESIKRHPEFGLSLLNIVQAANQLAPIIKHHHERYDGRGYPLGLKGKEIPFGARLLAIADAYDAMTTDRPYRPSLSKPAAIAELKKNAGVQFDPDLIEPFIELLLELDRLPT